MYGSCDNSNKYILQGKADSLIRNNAPVNFKIVPELLRIRAVAEQIVQ